MGGETALFLRRTRHSRQESKTLLADALARMWGFSQLPELARHPGGKPWFPQYPQCHFSLSHSPHFALCALSTGPVGCDVEEERPRRPDLPRRCLNHQEWRRYQALGGDWPAFYHLWVEKEAAAKYTGTGLVGDLTALTPPAHVHLAHFQVEGAHIGLCTEFPFRGMPELV